MNVIPSERIVHPCPEEGTENVRFTVRPVTHYGEGCVMCVEKCGYRYRYIQMYPYTLLARLSEFAMHPR